jgi:hypothetical protein
MRQSDGAGTKVESGVPAESGTLLKSQAGGMILMACAVVGCVLIAWGFQRNAKRKLAARDEEYESIMEARARVRDGLGAESGVAPAGARNQAELAADVAEIATLRHDLKDLGRRVVGEIDERLATLEATIVRADAVANRLEQAVRSAPGPSSRGGSPVAGSAHQPSAASVAGTHPDSFVEAMPERSPSPLHDPRSPRDETRAIIEMAEQGMSAREIAQRLSRPIGQVELIIALRGKGAAVRR